MWLEKFDQFKAPTHSSVEQVCKRWPDVSTIYWYDYTKGHFYSTHPDGRFKQYLKFCGPSKKVTMMMAGDKEKHIFVTYHDYINNNMPPLSDVYWPNETTNTVKKPIKETEKMSKPPLARADFFIARFSANQYFDIEYISNATEAQLEKALKERAVESPGQKFVAAEITRCVTAKTNISFIWE